MKCAQLESIRRDQAILDELSARADAGRLPGLREGGVSAEEFKSRLRELEPDPLESAPTPGSPEGLRPPTPHVDVAEAIVMRFGRPSLLVQNGTFALPDSSTWRQVLTTSRTNIEGVIQGVGRLELVGHLELSWAGTAWMIAPGVAVTNRHVANLFTRRENGSLSFATNLFGQPIGANVDFREEFEVAEAQEIQVEDVIFLADDGVQHPDIALLRLRSDVPLPEPLPLQLGPVTEGQLVGTVGYPAFDSRNALDALLQIFGDIFDVKRFAPGRVSSLSQGEHWFVHDCTTTGGASGSPVFDLDTGAVVGLHFSGLFERGNFAVKSSFLQEVLTKHQIQPLAPEDSQDEPEADGTNEPAHFESRDGYQVDFLGTDHVAVELPDLCDWAEDVAPVSDSEQGVLAYRHFSVVVSKSRKLPLLTACNVDGNDLRSVPRIRDWFLDGRVALKYQAGNELYKRNDFDRGHMVRRLDPVWGDRATASEANDDTFHYVNAAPQHKDLNQRDWLALEEYILDSAKAKDLKVSVFTGPVLAPGDPTYRGVQIPLEFWKVAVLVNSDTDELAAAGYLLTHEQLIQGMLEAAFVFGEFRTFQVPTRLIESKTGLSFDLHEHDPLDQPPAEEAVLFRQRVVIESPDDLVLD